MKLQNQPLDSKPTNSKVFDKFFIQNQASVVQGWIQSFN
jgi:hypothetical protein